MDRDSEAIFAGSLPEIRAFGRMVFDPVWAERTHATNACEILHVIEGRMTLRIGEAAYPAGPGDTLFVPRGAPHRDEFDLDRGLDILYGSFHWAAADAYFERVAVDAAVRLPAGRRARLAVLFDELRQDPPGGRPLDRMLLRARLLTVLLFLLREADPRPAPETTTSAGHLMRRAKEYIHGHYAECVALADIAEALRVSPYHLSHVFSQESDFSLFAYLTHVRMNRARELLAERSLNVSEVSRAVGYEDANYFAKVFRKHVGCAPSAFASDEAAGS